MSHGAFRIGGVTSSRDREIFVRLPAMIHRHDERCVPPLSADEIRFLDPCRNHAFTYSDVMQAVAWRGDRPVGRIVGIVNHRHNALGHEPTARFGSLECENDSEAVQALLGYVEDWARQRGMRRVVGPMGFTDQDPEGLLVDGFEHEPSIASYCNAEYLVPLVESAGYGKEIDYVVYRLSVPDELPQVYERVLQRISRRSCIRMLELSDRRQLARWSRQILELMGETFVGLYGFVPPDPEEMEDLSRRFIRVLDPRFIKVALDGSLAVGFLVAMPNLAPGFRRAKGRLFPLGLFHLLRAARRSRQLDLLIGGIQASHRGRGVDALLGAALMRSARAAGFEFIDSHHMLESNLAVRSEMERLGGQIYKRFRIYRKVLAPA